MGFSDLKKKTSIESSGHLQHHLSKLNGLVKTDEYGKYILSDQGRDALHSVETVEKTSKAETKQNLSTRSTKKVFLLNATVVILILVLAVSSAAVLLQHSQIETLQTKVNEQTSEISQIQNQLDDALSALAIKPATPHYLTLGGKDTKIFLVSAIPQYGTWQLNDTSIGYPSYLPSAQVIHHGDPVFTISVTVRNDYTINDAANFAQLYPNAPISNVTGSYSSFIILTGQLYSQNGSIINATDITQPRNVYGGYEFRLKSGETTSFNIVFDTTSRDVNRFDIYALEVSSLPQP